MLGSHKTVFLILPRIHLMDLAGPVQVFYEADRLGAEDYKLYFVGLKSQEMSEQGLGLCGLEPYKELELSAGDRILVPGIDFAYYSSHNPTSPEKELLNWVRENHRRGVIIGSICSGALVLAKAGLLDYVKCTSHWKCIDFIRSNFPKVKILSDRVFVKDRGFITSAGMTSGIDMALSMVEAISGPVTAANVAREMVVYLRRHGMERQHSYYLDYRTHFNPTVHKVQNYLVNHMYRNPTIEELGDLFSTSERNLTRLFKKHAGITIQEYKDALRLELAGHLLNNPDNTQRYIASECGFRDERQFRRLWKRKYGHPPSKHMLVQ